MTTYDDTEADGMNERGALLDFPGADELATAGHVEPLSERALARVLAEVEAAVATEGAAVTTKGATGVVVAMPERRLLGRQFGRRRALIGLLTTAAVATGVVTYANSGTTSAGTGAHSEARANTASVFLDDISTVAASQSAASGKYWKMRTTVGDEYISQSMDYYVVNSGKVYRKGLRPDWQVGPKDLDWKGLEQLTTDSGKLLGLLQSPPRPKSISPFDQAVTLLTDSPASPKLRAGVFKAMGGLKGVKLLGQVKDSTGRGGTAVEFAEARSLGQVIIDPKTSAILEYTFTWTAGPSKGKVTHETFLSTGFTDKLG
ncbi:hypothetical protein OG194_22325 [Streptomyces sp. NBC_01288]|uniref:hypothetical protein n=1 Tax=Streptomyces sp. NBC_01288 TaxID=2903814 RepID=UPI002E14A120|nr:hypothetical protein OG194_22325 [Streptomyces sp. NBC_01288]